MTDKKEKTIETIETLEKGKQPDPQSVELEEELSAADIETVAGASGHMACFGGER